MRKKMFKRAVSLVIALMMILSGTQVSLAVAGHPYGMDDIELEKTATKVEDKENTYKIQLSVKGKDIETGKKVDVILVIDNSNSMHNDKNLAQITRDAANVFIDGVLTEGNDNIRVAVVQYGTYARAYQFGNVNDWTSHWGAGPTVNANLVFTNNKANAKTAVNSATTKFSDSNDGGTNTEGGFLMADKVASAGREDAESIVIFMTDGLPTYRYDGYSAVDDSSGTNTSKKELNEAIEAAQALSAKSTIYTVGLLSNYTVAGDEVKLASYLLSTSPKSYNRSRNNSNIMQYVNSDRWSDEEGYAEKYYDIYEGDDASEEMNEIYANFAGTVNALAIGKVTDVIPANFKLTEDSVIALGKKGVVITKNEDGTTKLVFDKISASGKINYLPTFEVIAEDDIYGTGYTNKEAYYDFVLYGETAEKTKYFEKPIVALYPTAADDFYIAYQGQILNVAKEEGILENDGINEIEEGGYKVKLFVGGDYVTTITTEKGGTVELAADGSFKYTPPDHFIEEDSFVYENKATVTGEGPLAGDYISNEATVTIKVNSIPVEKYEYTIYYYINGTEDLVPGISPNPVTGEGLAGDVIKIAYPEASGYKVMADQPESLTITSEGAVAVVYYEVDEDIPEPEEVSYTVQYLDKDTGKPVDPEKAPEKTGYGYPGDEVTEYAVDVDGYTPDLEEITFDVEEGLVITFWYTKDEPQDSDYDYIKVTKVWSSNSPNNKPTIVIRLFDGDEEIDSVELENGETTHVFMVKIEAADEPDEPGDDPVVYFSMDNPVGDPGDEDPENGDPGDGDPENEDPENGDPENGDPENGEPENGEPENGDPENEDPENEEPAARVYSVTEEILKNSKDYKTTIEEVGGGFKITNTYNKTSPGPGPGPGPSPDPVIIEDPEVPAAELEKFDHFAYIIGYPEGDVRPLNNITREEVAMIFYRLLTDDSRNALLSDVNPFTDMESGRWSNRAISTLFNADIISGYPDGSFRPSAPITRAEFATIAAKFDELNLGNESKFTDIVEHWAKDYITSSENKGWIKGYPDMTFKPDQDITRAEAMTLINNVLERGVPAENIHPDAIFWPDNPKVEWYFEAVMEATNSHDYVYEEDGDELWTGMKANKVWP